MKAKKPYSQDNFGLAIAGAVCGKTPSHINEDLLKRFNLNENRKDHVTWLLRTIRNWIQDKIKDKLNGV